MHSPPLLFRPKAAGSAVRINLLVFHKILNEKLDLDASIYSKPYAEFQSYDEPQVNQQPSFQAKVHAVFQNSIRQLGAYILDIPHKKMILRAFFRVRPVFCFKLAASTIQLGQRIIDILRTSSNETTSLMHKRYQVMGIPIIPSNSFRYNASRPAPLLCDFIV